MAAFQIGGQLHLVDGDKGGVGVTRHGLNRRDPVTRLGRNDLFLAGDQRNPVFAGAPGDALIDFARQKPQRQADQAGFVAEHALNGQMRLAGIGRPKNGCDVARAPALLLCLGLIHEVLRGLRSRGSWCCGARACH